LQTHAQRLLLVGSTPVHHPFTPAVPQSHILPQNEQLSTFAQATEPEDTVDYINATGLSVPNDVSEPVSLQASDDEVEEVATERVMDFVACHGASPAVADNVNDSSSTLAEIFRCFICLGKVFICSPLVDCAVNSMQVRVPRHCLK
jgi:tripartite motif-containing protein 37